MIETIRKNNKNVLVLDAGDIISKDQKDPDLRAEVLSSGMVLMKYDGAAVGDLDFGMGIDFFKNTILKNGLPFVSANIAILSEAKQKPPIDRYILKKKGSLNVGITSVTSPSFFRLSDEDKKTVSIENPGDSLKKVISDIYPKTDLLIVMLHIGNDAVKKFIVDNDIKGPHIFIGGHGRNMTTAPEMIGNSFFVENGLDGEYISVLQVMFDKLKKPVSCDLENIPLTPEKPENSEVMKIMKIYEDKCYERSKAHQLGLNPPISESERQGMLKMSPDEFMKKIQQENKD